MCNVFLFLGCLDVLFFSSHPALRSFSEPTQCRDPITGDRQDTEQLSLLPLPVAQGPSWICKKSSRIQLGKQCLSPQGFFPQNSCDPFNLPYDFSKLPPAQVWSSIWFSFWKEQDTQQAAPLPQLWGKGSTDTSVLHAGPGTSEFPASWLSAPSLSTKLLSLQLCPLSRNGIPKGPCRGAEVALLQSPMSTATLSLLFPYLLLSLSDSAQPLLIHLCSTPGESTAALWLPPSLGFTSHPFSLSVLPQPCTLSPICLLTPLPPISLPKHSFFFVFLFLYPFLCDSQSTHL